jgi:hypothetical protein
MADDQKNMSDFHSLSPISPKSDRDASCVSPFSCDDYDDDEMCTGTPHRRVADEMPIFPIESLSPSGRSISPISDTIDNDTYSLFNISGSANNTPLKVMNKDEFVSLEDINAQIGMTPPPEYNSRSRVKLETIFEGVFLETPPKQREAEELLKKTLRSSLQFCQIQKMSIPSDDCEMIDAETEVCMQLQSKVNM